MDTDVKRRMTSDEFIAWAMEQPEFEPDVAMRCGEKLDYDVVKIKDPLIVVEVLSPSARARDLNTKLDAYFRVANLRHYLVVDPRSRRVIRYSRDDAGQIATMILGDQPITLDPPGIVLENIFA